MNMWRLSRYWNRVAYFFINLGRRMIWDYSGENADLLKEDYFASDYAESILCDRE